MTVIDLFGLSAQWVGDVVYIFAGWVGGATIKRPRSILDAVGSLFVSFAFARAAADGVAHIIANMVNVPADLWRNVALLVLAAGGVSLLHAALGALSSRLEKTEDK